MLSKKQILIEKVRIDMIKEGVISKYTLNSIFESRYNYHTIIAEYNKQKYEQTQKNNIIEGLTL